jgi:hypothetical protein
MNGVTCFDFRGEKRTLVYAGCRIGCLSELYVDRVASTVGSIHRVLQNTAGIDWDSTARDIQYTIYKVCIAYVYCTYNSVSRYPGTHNCGELDAKVGPPR